MTRVLSALLLLPVVVGIIWWLPAAGTVALAAVVLLLAFVEYAGLARAAGIEFARVPVGAATLATGGAIALAPTAAPVVLMAAGLVVAATALADRRSPGTVVAAPRLADRRSPATLASVGAAGFAVLYLGVPVGALAALRVEGGRETLLLLLATVMVSDTAQYYGGRALGSRPLAPAVSPNKTVEGAVCGVVAAMGVLAVAGTWWLPATGATQRIALGATLALLGIGGDLFESRLKRASHLKDASSLIPGHGGVLDRIDALLFAAPVYYTVVVYAGAGSP